MRASMSSSRETCRERVVVSHVVEGCAQQIGDPLPERVEVERSQGPVDVVGATHGPPTRHARETGHCRCNQPGEGRIVVARERLRHQGDEVVGRDERTAILGGAHRVDRRRVVTGPTGTTSPRREVDIEERVERGPMPGVLDERGAERGPERLTIRQVDACCRARGVEVLGGRHRQAGGAQLPNEFLERVEQRSLVAPTRRRRGHTAGSGNSSSRRARSRSDSYLSRTWSVSETVAASTSARPR